MERLLRNLFWFFVGVSIVAVPAFAHPEPERCAYLSEKIAKFYTLTEADQNRFSSELTKLRKEHSLRLCPLNALVINNDNYLMKRTRYDVSTRRLYY